MARTPHFEDVLGPLAAAIVREVVSRGQATVAEVVEGLRASQPRQHAYTTIMTVMVRLYERGVLERDRRGRPYGRQYVYRPAAPEAQLIDRMSQVAVDQLVERYGTAALRHFAVKLADLDPATRARLAELAEES